MKKLLLLFTVLSLVLLPMAAMANQLADLTGERFVGSGIDVFGNEPPEPGWDFNLSWVITPNPVGSDYLYTYCYTISTPKVTIPTNPALSHWSLQITQGKTLEDFANFYIENGLKQLYSDVFLNQPDFPAEVDNIKFDNVTEQFAEEYTTYSFYFDTNLPPVWGDFFAKGGGFTAKNSGFGIDPVGPDYTDWIARPNGVAPIPGSLLLLGTGLLGLLGWRRLS